MKEGLSVSDDGFTPPSRERFRQERRAARAAKRRSRMVGVPAVFLGIGLVGAGMYMWYENDVSDSPVDVQGTSVERTTTSTTTTTLPPTTLAPTTTAKPKPKPKPTTSVAPVETTAATVPVTPT